MPESLPRLLLAMGNPSQAAQYTAYLESRGFTVRCVYSGKDLLKALTKHGPDLVMLDFSLPDGDAIWVVERLSANHYHGPVIVTTPPQADPRNAALKQRTVLLQRPFSLVRLHETIMSLVTDLKNVSLPEAIAGQHRDENERRKNTFLFSNTAAKNKGLTNQIGTPHPSTNFGHFIGTSPVMLNLYEQIQSAALSNATVFITGESGTGKENCAQAIHKHSHCADRPFVPLNCAAIPGDLLESELFGHVRGAFIGAVSDREGAAKMADGGTLFLDEIGDMDPLMQTKLLRYLQDGTFQRVGASQPDHSSARIICATNRDPLADMRSGRLREDLFYRLHVLPIIMPPLRLRGEDVVDIGQTLLLRFATEEKKRFKAFADDAETILRSYNWPGNIRQLQNIIRHAVVMHDGLVLTAKMLPVHMLHGQSGNSAPNLSTAAEIVPTISYNTPRTALGHLDGSLRQKEGRDMIQPLHITERRAIERALRACGDNIPRAAALLQVSPSTLYRKKALWEPGWKPADTAPAEGPETAQTAKKTDLGHTI